MFLDIRPLFESDYESSDGDYVPGEEDEEDDGFTDEDIDMEDVEDVEDTEDGADTGYDESEVNPSIEVDEEEEDEVDAELEVRVEEDQSQMGGDEQDDEDIESGGSESRSDDEMTSDGEAGDDLNDCECI